MPVRLAVAAALLALTLCAPAGAQTGDAVDGKCMRLSLRFESQTYMRAGQIGRGRPAVGSPVGTASYQGCSAARSSSVRVSSVSDTPSRVALFALEPEGATMFVATGYLAPLPVHPLYRWLYAPGTPERPVDCTRPRRRVTGQALAAFDRDMPFVIATASGRRIEVIVSADTAAERGLRRHGVPYVGRDDIVDVVGPGCPEWVTEAPDGAIAATSIGPAPAPARARRRG